MGRDHFAQLYKNKSHRHDSISDYDQFQKDVGAICGMLYNIVTLNGFSTSRPNSPDSDPQNKITKD